MKKINIPKRGISGKPSSVINGKIKEKKFFVQKIQKIIRNIKKRIAKRLIRYQTDDLT
jgi:hypothetical protein